MVTSSATRSPTTRPVLPRISSAKSGFFFCGMMDDPVENASDSSMNPNSELDHSTISSHSRDRCMHDTLHAYDRSSRKSRSDTASSEFGITREKPSSAAVICRSSGYVVPASAAEPSGLASAAVRAAARRSKSRASIHT